MLGTCSWNGFSQKHLSCKNQMHDVELVWAHFLKKYLSMPTFDLEFYFKLILTLNFIIASLVFPIIIYIVLRHSRQLNRYKFYLANVVIWAYLLEFGAFMLKPKLLLPRYCLSVQPLFLMSQEAVWFATYLLLLILGNMCVGVLGLVFYRYFKAYQGWISRCKYNKEIVFEEHSE